VKRGLQEALISLITVAVAFAIGGLAVLIAGSDPIEVYKSMWLGAGFDWPFYYLPGNPFGVDLLFAEFNLQQTLINFTPLVLAGLAVAFAFRCGLFNIGGQGQYWVGAVCGLEIALRVDGVFGLVLATIGAAAGGAVWGGIAGVLKAVRGAHEVVTTIMLTWIAIYGTQYLYQVGGPFADEAAGQPISLTLPEGGGYRTIWGDLQALHIGIFIALGCVVLFWVLLNRTTLGYEVRAVGFNPEGARYGGVSVKRAIALSLAISGAFAGLAGASDVLGVQYVIAGTEIPASTVGFTGIAVALLGRNSAVGVVLAALLFASLDSGARNIAGDFPSELARSLGTIIQGTIILVVGGEALVRWLLRRRRASERETPPAELPPPAPAIAAETPA